MHILFNTTSIFKITSIYVYMDYYIAGGSPRFLTGMGGCLAGMGGCLTGMGGCLTGIGGCLTGIVTEIFTTIPHQLFV